MSDWIDDLSLLSPDLTYLPPAPPEVVARTESELGELPPDLRQLLLRSNGLSARSFRVFSAYDPHLPAKTWESLQRVNDPHKTGALGGDQDLLARFLVFADIGNGFAAWDRSSGSVWYEESSEHQLHETDLTLRAFVEMMIRNAE